MFRHRKAEPRRLYIEYNLTEQGFSPQVFCVFDNEKRSTEQVDFFNTTSSSVYQGTIYLSPNPGKISLLASYQGLLILSGYSRDGFGGQRIVIKAQEHYVPFSFTPVNLRLLP